VLKAVQHDPDRTLTQENIGYIAAARIRGAAENPTHSVAQFLR